MNDHLLKQIKRHEGLVKHAYQDHLGYWTIGYGRLIDEKLGGGLSEDEASFLLRNDIARAYADLINNHPWVDDLDAARRDVLINMCFNMGISRLNKFVQTLAAVRAGEYEAAASEMLDSLWAEQVGDRAKELAEQMLTGQYQ
jgi:lysozyme